MPWLQLFNFILPPIHLHRLPLVPPSFFIERLSFSYLTLKALPNQSKRLEITSPPVTWPDKWGPLPRKNYDQDTALLQSVAGTCVLLGSISKRQAR
jgi:hypothetical protein